MKESRFGLQQSLCHRPLCESGFFYLFSGFVVMLPLVKLMVVIHNFSNFFSNRPPESVLMIDVYGLFRSYPCHVYFRSPDSNGDFNEKLLIDCIRLLENSLTDQSLRIRKVFCCYVFFPTFCLFPWGKRINDGTLASV